ncbi:glycosyltransferase family 4 protein [Cryobacterium sp. MLB-32]|uniref:glycosyltransferase family 4 protein n=1 Tax=Cryobacterium sp. MLB-32 TaxID=1529318 RepID=UPI00055F0522|nr:glycosyltransferase family 4 protein [Cryobacterium sp. MLB-32]
MGADGQKSALGIAVPGVASRACARASALMLGFASGVIGTLPPRVRYGYVHRFAGVLLHKPLRSLPALDVVPRSVSTVPVAQGGDLTCVLGVGAIDIGGIGSVVELLATHLSARGVEPAVVCCGDGVRARRIRALGIDVRSVDDHASAVRAFAELRPDVIQLHGSPAFIEAAARETGVPVVPVMHNTEIHVSRARWRRFSNVLRQSSSAIAVSEIVRAFHAARVATPLRSRIVVIPNAAPGLGALSAQQRRAARDLLEEAVGGHFGDDVVFVCLARYDAQKNIVGTVASFLACVSTGVPAQLVVAGEPSDWVEFRRADAIRRGSRNPDRVHLLSTSDARSLLGGADAFVLNSFFEGWPVAATEAWAAGLPLLLSDVGGARELVARDPERSVLISNASGNANEVTDARVEHTRWHARHQSNSSELGDAVQKVVTTVLREREVPVPPREIVDGVATMIDAHVRVLRDAARATPAGGSKPVGRRPGEYSQRTVTT